MPTMTAERPSRTRTRRAGARLAPARVRRADRKLRDDLDPAYYKTIEDFRRAVADGTVDVSKGCRDMDEYFGSLAHG